MKFEWDENKRLINLKMHGIDFIDVQKFSTMKFMRLLMTVLITKKFAFSHLDYKTVA
jgi:uncharacterized DUF497 family protein